MPTQYQAAVQVKENQLGRASLGQFNHYKRAGRVGEYRHAAGFRWGLGQHPGRQQAAAIRVDLQAQRFREAAAAREAHLDAV